MYIHNLFSALFSDVNVMCYVTDDRQMKSAKDNS